MYEACMTAEVVGGREERKTALPDVYQSPQDMLRTTVLARDTLQAFLLMYGSKNLTDNLPVIERYCKRFGSTTYAQEVWTGYGDLGEVIHIRVIPALMDEAEGYFVARANLATGDIDEPILRRVERFRDTAGPQTLLYFDDERCKQWPAEYQPMIHFDQMSYRLTYRHGFGAGQSLLRPIEGLCAELPPHVLEQRTPSPIGRRALELVRGATTTD
jgi:hypothetical protein